ncbi:MAG: ectoine/hydroxyectoine ABC transporter permease subunit EhuC [Nitrospinota bacterium]
MEIFELAVKLLAGLKVTVTITFCSALLALVAAFTAGLARLSKRAWLRVPALVYIDLFRGTSALVQLFWAYFALPLFGIKLDALTVGIVVLGLNIGSYGAEVVRGAVQAVPRGQGDAAVALNFTPSQAMRLIILPQALVAMLPPFGNLLIELLKSTALVSLITLSDLTFEAQILRSETLRSADVFTMVLVMYFLVAQAMNRGVRYMEKRMTAGRDWGGVV